MPKTEFRNVSTQKTINKFNQTAQRNEDELKTYKKN